MEFIKHFLLTFSAKITTVVFHLAAVIVIARVLGPEGNGEYALIILIPSILVLVGNLGLGLANIYFGGSKKYEWAQIVSNSVVSAVMLGIPLTIAFLAYFLVSPPSFLAEIEPRSLVLATLTVPFSLLTIYFNLVLLGNNRVKEYNTVLVIQGGASLLLTLFLLLALNGGIFSAILAWTIGTVMATILSFLFVRRITRIVWSFHPRLFKDSLRFGIQGFLGNIIQFLNYRLDMLMVAHFMSVIFVGYYSVAVIIAESLWYLPAAAGTIVLARTPGLSIDEANRSTPQICRTTFFITILTSLALFGLGKYIIILFFGSTFLPAAEPLWILLPGIVALSICKVLSHDMVGRGKPMINTVAAGVSLAVNIPLNLLLIPKMGISGAALASTVSYTLVTVVVLIYFLSVSKNSLFDTIVIKPRDLRILVKVMVKGLRLLLDKTGGL